MATAPKGYVESKYKGANFLQPASKKTKITPSKSNTAKKNSLPAKKKPIAPDKKYEKARKSYYNLKNLA
jgi:hypothetical protein